MFPANETTPATAAPTDSTSSHKKASVLALAVGSIGVVYGDIGTSPLYAFRESVKAANGTSQQLDPASIYAVLSAIIWSLLLVVTLKYVFILLNADNKGEGGTLSLMALAQRGRGKFIPAIPILGMIGAALFYGDGMITPAISVLSAVEGLNIVAPALSSWVIWITLAIVIMLFAVQSAGTAKVANFFGPITLIWFVVIGFLGLQHISGNLSVLTAFNPMLALKFLSHQGAQSLLILGAVFLAVTGAEALYADLGHFGKQPIRLAWFCVALPCLLLNYLGQGALLLQHPETIENPFFLMAPSWAQLPLVLLATAATIIASQAVITGAYSLTRQAVQLGLLPRMKINFTSETNTGQIYLPQINWFLLAGVIMLVLAFKSSSALSTAYGIAVTGTMVVTTTLAMFVITNRWRWNFLGMLALMLPLLAIDVLFLIANSLKIMEGGWVPLAIAAAVITLMWTWRKGVKRVIKMVKAMDVSVVSVVKSLGSSKVSRAKGTAVFFTADPDTAPAALLHTLKHFQVLHNNNIILTVRTADEPYAQAKDRYRVTVHSPSFMSVILTFGYMEAPNVPAGLGAAKLPDIDLDPMKVTYFLSRRSFLPSREGGMPYWQDKLFIALAKSGNDASAYFQLPVDRVVEIGNRIMI